MAQYKNKISGALIDALQITPSSLEDIRAFISQNPTVRFDIHDNGSIHITNPGGQIMMAKYGDWIMRDDENGYWAIRTSDLESQYDKVSD